ncbi:MAG: glycosyltransferase family 39 protein [Candidatus Micrarchaeota archaeon]
MPSVSKTEAAAIACFAALSAFGLQFHAYAMDEYTYMNAAEAFHTGAPDMILAGETSRSPYFPLALSLAYPWLGGTETGGKILNIFFAGIGILAVYFFARELFGRDAAGWSALLLATNPLNAFLFSRILSESMFITLLILCAYLAHKAAKDPRYMAPLGLATGLLIMTRYIGLYMLPVIIAYFWRAGRLGALFSKWAAAGVAAFALSFLPFVFLSAFFKKGLTDFITEFFRAAFFVKQGAQGWPDRIPSYLLALPLLLGFALPALAAGAKDAFARRRESAYFATAFPAAFIAITMEIYGLFNSPLLRYISVVVPLLCIAAASAISPGRKIFGLDLRTVAWAAVGLNLLASFAGIYAVDSLYLKHAEYREAGLYAAKECKGMVFSNFPAAMNHYLRQPTSYAASEYGGGQACVAVSGYDAWNLPQPESAGYRLAKTAGNIKIYKLS